MTPTIRTGVYWILALVLLGAGGLIESWGVVMGIAGFVLALILTSQLPRGRGIVKLALVAVLVLAYALPIFHLFVGRDPRLLEAYGKRAEDTILKEAEVIRPEAVDARAILQEKCNQLEVAETNQWSVDLQKVGPGGDMKPLLERLVQIKARRKVCEGYVETGSDGGLRAAIIGPKEGSGFRLPELASLPIPETVWMSVIFSVLVMGLALGLIQSRGFRIVMAIAAFFVGYFYLAYIYRTTTAEVAPSMAAPYYQPASAR